MYHSIIYTVLKLEINDSQRNGISTTWIIIWSLNYNYVGYEAIWEIFVLINGKKTTKFCVYCYVYKEETVLGNKDADLLENGLEDTGMGKGKLGQSERVAWTYLHYQT